MRRVSSSGKPSRRRRAICSGLHGVAHRRSCRRPRRRPFHGTTGPRTAAPVRPATVPAPPPPPPPPPARPPPPPPVGPAPPPTHRPLKKPPRPRFPPRLGCFGGGGG